MVYDGEGRVVEANEPACSLLGLSRDDLVGSSAEDSDWLVIESVEGPFTVHPVLAAIRTGQPVRGVLLRARRPGGADVWLQVDAVPYLAAAQVVATLSDVTHLIAHSRVSTRSSGDHIVDEVTDRLAQARMEPQAILTTVTRALSKFKPGIWVASLMGKDPSDIQRSSSRTTTRPTVTTPRIMWRRCSAPTRSTAPRSPLASSSPASR